MFNEEELDTSTFMLAHMSEKNFSLEIFYRLEAEAC